MYKRLNFDQLTQINTDFFKNLHKMYTRKWHTLFKWFLREVFEDSNSHYFWDGTRPLFRMQKLDTQQYRFVDEKDKIECILDDDGINKVHNLLKNMRQVDKIANDNLTIIEWLFSKCVKWDLQYIQDKPFVTYDIETTYDGEGISHQYFEMAYSVSTHDLSKGLVYNYIDNTSMQRYCDYLLEYPGWIVWYNQIWFDNPVLIHNCGYGQAELDILNMKSIDPFLLLYKLLRKRLKLTKVAESLVSMGKTLDSGAEGSKLLNEYKRTGDKKALNKVKKYCKNDVRITLGIFLYLLEHKKVHIEWESKEFSIQQMIERWNTAKNDETQDGTQWWFFQA